MRACALAFAVTGCAPVQSRSAALASLEASARALAITHERRAAETTAEAAQRLEECQAQDAATQEGRAACLGRFSTFRGYADDSAALAAVYDAIVDEIMQAHVIARRLDRFDER